MNIFPFPKKSKQKENDCIKAKNRHRFYPQSRRLSQMGTINQMLLISEGKTVQFFLPEHRELSHFKKNQNKIEWNILHGKKQQLSQIKSVEGKVYLGDASNCKENESKLRKSEFYDHSLRSNKNKIKSGLNTYSEGFERKKNYNTSTDIIKAYKIYPRYKILELYSLYLSIIQYSERNPQKFLQAFESALNYRKIVIKPEILKKNFYEQKTLEFKNFLQVYKKMEDLMFIQSIVDYLQIIFQAYSLSRLNQDIVYQILVKRSESAAAKEITEVIFEKLTTERDKTVSLQQILELCQRDIQFCSTFSKLYQHEPI